jgi:hypothetical protein
MAGVPLLLTGLVTGALLLGTGTAQLPTAAAGPVAAAAPRAELAAPTTVKQGKRTVTVDPAAKIDATDAAITVTGTGFDNSEDLWVAICQADGAAPKDMSACLGGPIPDENATTSWGVVTDAGDAPPGPVQAKWSGDGFTLTLQVAADNDGADCPTKKCAVYVRSAGDSRSQDVAVPIAFAAPAGSVPATTSRTTTTTAATSTSSSSAPTTSAEPTTSSSAEPTTSSTPSPVPTTVQAQSVLLPEIAQGREQVVVFTGFQPGELATVTLSGNRVKLPDVRADQSGAVRVDWTVPKDFPVGGYTVRVEGQTSLRVGEAGFAVIAAAPPTTASAEVTSPAPTTPSTPASPTPTTVTSSVETTTSATTTSVTESPTETSAVTSAAAIGAPASDTGSGTPWWLWITLAAVLLVGLVVAAVAMGRRHREDADAERARREAELAAAAEAEAMRHPHPAPGPATPMPPGFDEHPDRPILFSHRQAEQSGAPTEAIGDPNAPTQAIGSPGEQQGGRHSAPEPPGTQQFDPFGDDDAPPAGPGTQQFDPFGDDDAPPAGPGTQQFDPFADDRNIGPDDDVPDGGDDTSQWRPPSP